MCGQFNRSRRCAARQSQWENNCCCCCCAPMCGCEDTAPSATISMADYEPFILVPTTVFDQGDVACGRNGVSECGRDW